MTTTSIPGVRHNRPPSRLRNWIGVVPFFIFALLFIILPSLRLFVGAFTNTAGQFTIANLLSLFSNPYIVNGFLLSIRLSAATAFVGGILGFLVAYSVTVGGIPPVVRPFVITFSGVAANFAGVPLAFAFVAILGRTGLFTVLMKNIFHMNLYNVGFNLYSFLGLCLVYTFFQFPLMVLIMAPALDGLKREWREAAENLGANSRQYWLRVAMPILLPSILGSMILLFGNAFGAWATAYALVGEGQLQVITVEIGAQIRGDVMYNPGLGFAMAFGMVAVMAISLLGYSLLQQLTERWLQ
jgi:putative spermidine/putrescine transport system permease protein